LLTVSCQAHSHPEVSRLVPTRPLVPTREIDDYEKAVVDRYQNLK